MNCRQYQKRILHAFAAGEPTLPAVVVRHNQNCEACRAYYESQAGFFCSLEEGIKVIANEEVPPSLLAGVRARLLDRQSSHSPSRPAWGMAAALAAALAVSLGSVFLYRPKHGGAVSENRTAAAHGVERPVVARPELPQAAKPPFGRRPKRANARALGSDAENSEVLPEVIVLREERAAFARFVAEAPPEQEVALAVTGTALPNDELTAEIVALEIEGLEVRSLDPGWE